jgi:lysine-N-methylase
MAPLVAALGRAIEKRLEHWGTWRSSEDPILRIAQAALLAARQLEADPGVSAEAGSDAQLCAEAFTVHARLHAHGLVDDLPLEAALRDQAVRLMVARRLPALLGRATPSLARDCAADQPIALVETLVRGHGLWAAP